MEEKNYSINWIGLFIKVIIFVVVVLFAIWLITKIIDKNKGLTFEENNKIFKEASIEYFKKNMPEENKTKTVTLKQLINWDYTKELTNEDGKVCDAKSSKSTIELIDNYYTMTTELVCGSKKEITYTKIGDNKCKDCDVKLKDLEISKETKNTEPVQEEQSNQTTNSNNSKAPTSNEITNNITISQPQILYEHIKQANEYSTWYEGKVSGKNIDGNDIESSTKQVSYSKYCKKYNSDICLTDKTENKNNYPNYNIVKTWNETMDIYRYKITVIEYLWSTRDYVEGYVKTGNFKTIN